MSRFPRLAGLIGLSLTNLLAPAVHAQFKEIGPPPFSKAVAHQRIRALLDRVEPGNLKQTLDQLNGLVPWFREVLDDELISGWRRDSRERLLPVLEPMADPAVAGGVVAFSWHSRTDATFQPAYAAMLAHLMARYPDSGREFLSDLLAASPPPLGPLQEETVCRILIEMPDVGNWSQNALRILPQYRQTAVRLLQQYRESPDQDQMYRARMWLDQLHGERTGAVVGSAPRRRSGISPVSGDTAGPILRPSPPPPPVRAPDPPPPVAAPEPPVYSGPMSGTLQCTGNPVPQNAELVFRNLPPVRLQFDYDRKIWEARVVPGENQSQRLILKNKSSGPQKRCVVHWSAIP